MTAHFVKCLSCKHKDLIEFSAQSSCEKAWHGALCYNVWTENAETDSFTEIVDQPA